MTKSLRRSLRSLAELQGLTLQEDEIGDLSAELQPLLSALHSLEQDMHDVEPITRFQWADQIDG